MTSVTNQLLKTDLHAELKAAYREYIESKF